MNECMPGNIIDAESPGRQNVEKVGIGLVQLAHIINILVAKHRR